MVAAKLAEGGDVHESKMVYTIDSDTANWGGKFHDGI
jgi:hypothetical protein